MTNKYSEEQIQGMIEIIKKKYPNRPELATREFAIRTLDKTSSLSGKLIGNLESVAKEEKKKSKKTS